MNKKFSITTEDEELLGYISNIIGLTGNYKTTINNEIYNKLTLEACAPAGRLEEWCLGKYNWKYKNAVNVDVNILNYQNEIIGSYYVSTFFPIKWKACDTDMEFVDITVVGHLNDVLSPHSLKIWDKFRKGLPEDKNQWVRLSADDRRVWLEIIRLYPRKYYDEDKASDTIFDIDGTYINDDVSFLCAIGEAINGPGGYFGACFDSLDDCLCGGFGASVPFILRWKHFCEENNSGVSEEIFNILLQRGIKIIAL